MRRRLLNLLTAVSLVLCVAACVLWVRSYYRAERIEFQRSHLSGPRQYQVAQSLFVADGLAVFVRDLMRAEYEGDEVITGPLFEPRRLSNGLRRDSAPPRRFLDNLNDSDYWPHYGFLAETRGTAYGPRDGIWYTVVCVPCWVVAGAAALLPTVRLAAVTRRRLRRRANRCSQCGYDLTANVSGVCPECGKAV
jgi:hypothetical protein